MQNCIVRKAKKNKLIFTIICVFAMFFTNCIISQSVNAAELKSINGLNRDDYINLDSQQGLVLDLKSSSGSVIRWANGTVRDHEKRRRRSRWNLEICKQ